MVTKDNIKKIPFALGNLGLKDNQQIRLVENYIQNLIITSANELRTLSEEEYQKFLKSL